MQAGGVVDRLQLALVAQPLQHRGQGMLRVDLEGVVLGGALQDLLQAHARCLAAVLAPEGEHLLHLVPVQLDPLAAEAHQRRLRLDQLLPFLRGQGLVTDGQVVAVLDQIGQVDMTGAGAAAGALAGLARGRAQPQLDALATLGRPPGRHDDVVAGVFQHPGGFLQEVECAVQVQRDGLRLGAVEPAPEHRHHARGEAEVKQQVLLEVGAEAGAMLGAF